MVGDELVERVELNHPQEIFAGIITQHLEVLHLRRTIPALHTTTVARTSRTQRAIHEVVWSRTTWLEPIHTAQRARIHRLATGSCGIYSRNNKKYVADGHSVIVSGTDNNKSTLVRKYNIHNVSHYGPPGALSDSLIKKRPSCGGLLNSSFSESSRLTLPWFHLYIHMYAHTNTQHNTTQQ